MSLKRAWAFLRIAYFKTKALWEDDMIFLQCMFLIAFLVRGLFFGSIPGGLNQDEASTAYDAFSLLTDGMDRNGIHNPAVLISWGSGMNALSAYFSIPFIWLFGLNEVTARLVNFSSALISIVVFFLLLKRISGSVVARIGTFLLTVSPWHIMLSRWGVDENLFPAVFLLGTYLLVMSAHKRMLFILACAAFGLSLYAHGTSYFIVPLFTAPATLYLLAHKKIDIKSALYGWIVLVLLALPHLLYLAVNHFEWNTIVTPLISIPRLTGVPRYETVSSIFSDDFVRLTIENMRNFHNFLKVQNDGVEWNVIHRYGFMYLFSLPLAYLGSLLTLSRRFRIHHFHYEHLMLLWLLVGIALAFVLPVNVNRMNVLYLPLIFCIAAGIHFLKPNKAIFVSVITAYVVAFTGFTSAYFTEYPERISPVFFESFGDAVQTASAVQGGKICVTDRLNMPYIFVLFYNKVDPAIFRQTVVYENPGAEFQTVRSFDRYVFGQRNCIMQTTVAYVLTKDESAAFRKAGYEIRKFKHYDAVIVRNNPLTQLP